MKQPSNKKSRAHIYEKWRQKNQKRQCKHCEKIFVSNSFTKHGFCSYECRLLGSIEKDKNNCWNWIGVLAGGGYGRLRFEGKNIAAHRLSYKLFKGEIGENLFVCHSCDNKKCLNPDHLWIGTLQDNVNDAVKKGRVNMKGVKNRFCSLTEHQIEEFIILRNESITYQRLSRIFNSSEQHLRNIFKGRIRKKNNELDSS